MRKKYAKKKRKKKRNTKKSKRNTKNKMRRQTQKKKLHKIMKGGSLAGNFFRFLAGESEKDKIRVKELKELDEYKKQQQKEQERELDEHIDANNKKLSMEQENELNNYTNDKEIIDGNDINDLNKNIGENDEIDVLSQRGGGLIESINNMEKMNFNNWYKGSTNAYAKVVQKNDPDGLETVNWERKVVDDIPFHQKATDENVKVEHDTEGCPMQGGKRRKRKSRKKRRRRKKRRSRKN
jgi:hypothetical protein